MFNFDDLDTHLHSIDPTIRDLATYIQAQHEELTRLHAELSDSPPKALSDTLFHVKDRVSDEAAAFLKALYAGMSECWSEDTDSDVP